MQSNKQSKSLSTEVEVREFLQKYPPGPKLQRAMSNPYALRKKLSPEGKAALILNLTQEKVINLLDIEVHLLTPDDHIDLFAYCLRLLQNLENAKKHVDTKNIDWKRTLNAIKKIAKTIISKNPDTLENLLEKVVKQTLHIICERGDVDLLASTYNIIELENHRALSYTKQILYALLPLTDTIEDLDEIA